MSSPVIGTSVFSRYIPFLLFSFGTCVCLSPTRHNLGDPPGSPDRNRGRDIWIGPFNPSQAGPILQLIHSFDIPVSLTTGRPFISSHIRFFFLWEKESVSFARFLPFHSFFLFFSSFSLLCLSFMPLFCIPFFFLSLLYPILWHLHSFAYTRFVFLFFSLHFVHSFHPFFFDVRSASGFRFNTFPTPASLFRIRFFQTSTIFSDFIFISRHAHFGLPFHSLYCHFWRSTRFLWSFLTFTLFSSFGDTLGHIWPVPSFWPTLLAVRSFVVFRQHFWVYALFLIPAALIFFLPFFPFFPFFLLFRFHSLLFRFRFSWVYTLLFLSCTDFTPPPLFFFFVVGDSALRWCQESWSFRTSFYMSSFFGSVFSSLLPSLSLRNKHPYRYIVYLDRFIIYVSPAYIKYQIMTKGNSVDGTFIKL